jgi:sirohydrochlorin cobaltochelatase
MSHQGLILFAHGARDARWAAPFEAVARRVRLERPLLQVRLAFLEFMLPSLPEAAAQLCAAGCTSVEVLPLFLGTGGHLRNDLPPMVQSLCSAYPAVRWTLHPAVGEHEAVMQAMAGAALALLSDGGATPGPGA